MVVGVGALVFVGEVIRPVGVDRFQDCLAAQTVAVTPARQRQHRVGGIDIAFTGRAQGGPAHRYRPDEGRQPTSVAVLEPISPENRPMGLSPE